MEQPAAALQTNNINNVLLNILSPPVKNAGSTLVIEEIPKWRQYSSCAPEYVQQTQCHTKPPCKDPKSCSSNPSQGRACISPANNLQLLQKNTAGERTIVSYIGL